MHMVVVGGNSRNIGKTAVAAGLIQALPQYNWTAIKLTQYGHGLCAVDGKNCECAPEEHPFAVTEENDRSGRSDTSRFLVAGANRALWVRVRMGMLETALPSFRQAIDSDETVLVESNSILEYYDPVVHLTVLDPSRRDFKESARRFLPRAHAIVWLGSLATTPEWEGIGLEGLRDKPVFRVSPPQYVTQELAEFVQEKLAAAKAPLRSVHRNQQRSWK